ncbi:hypothetical protein [Microterricola pindariensis]|uniref:DUF2188 domain-containing protein n=1 Tax=Microterricola pindariensis TaxID=478010 RepID=A0ABX5AZI0_9MICO|nr:hypothetical protein [Microterricola pindariensis]PPL19934.1 hypothetical protein GY24_03205 [Microterricola pindariensis]
MSKDKPQKHQALEHKGREYTVQKTESGHWQITDDAGVLYGSIEMISRHGADDDPVYNGYEPGQTHFSHFGSDWIGIARTLINEFEAAHPRTITHY